MRQLEIDLSELELAFDNGSDMISFYLDIETGDVVNVSEEIFSILERLYDGYYNEQSQTLGWENAFENEDIPGWEHEVLKEADRVRAGLGGRFIEIPLQDSHEGYRDMEAFIDSVENSRLQGRLDQAISGRGPFRRFKDVLLDFPAERERWFKFKQVRLQQRIFRWLESQDITLLQ
jgi:hypothetical protein